MAATRHFDDEDDEFLLQVASAEAEALSRFNSDTSNKRRKFGGGYSGDEDQQLKKMAVAIDSTPKMNEAEEGAYMAALRGRNSVAWQQNPLNRSGSRVNAVSGGGSAGGGGGGDFNRQSERQQPSISEKDCPCGQGACVVFTANTERNRGRQFFRCPVRQENGGCGFFEWCDNASGNNYNSSTANSDLQCPCNAGFCKLLTAKTGKNVGQQFYCCPASQESSCGFFKWFNEPEVAANLPPASSYTPSKDSSNIGYGARSESSPCFKCQKPGHWAKDCPVSSVPVPTSAYNVSKDTSNIGYGARSESSPCFKCGQTGHWAKDCTISSSSDPRATASFGVGNRPASQSSNACYKCNKPGHWARDCTGSTQSTIATRRMAGITAVSLDSGKLNRKMESPSAGNSAKRKNLGMDEKDGDGNDSSNKRRIQGMDQKNRDGHNSAGSEVAEKEEVEQAEGNIVVSDEMAANISQITEKIERFTERVSEMLESGKAMFKDLSNQFEERLIAIHKQQIEQWQEDIKELQFIDAGNEEINAVLMNARYLIDNPNVES
ncbi:CCHC-type zinc finger nucleic acid binding protein [Linum grandiflorum]